MKKGMTLIEVIVSSLILVMSVTPMMYSFVLCKNMINESVHKMNATSIINQWFEGIQRRKTTDQIKTLVGTGDVSLGEEFQPIKVSEYLGNDVKSNYWLEFNISNVVTPDPSSDLVVVVARVSWDGVYVPKDSNKSLYMVMYSNEPL